MITAAKCRERAQQNAERIASELDAEATRQIEDLFRAVEGAVDNGKMSIDYDAPLNQRAVDLLTAKPWLFGVCNRGLPDTWTVSWGDPLIER